MEKDSPIIRAVGYWIGESTPSKAAELFPDPTKLVDATWCIEDRQRIVNYLLTGNVFARWRGRSYCRFDCSAKGEEMGSRCLTDGVWCWPEGLAHYVTEHDIRLPNAFVAHMRLEDWRVASSDVTLNRERTNRTFAFWIEWSQSQT